MLIAGLVLGLLIGAAIGYLYARGRIASTSADLASQASAAAERARAAEERATMIERAGRERAALIDGQLAQRFQSLSAEALDASTAASWRSPRGACARRTSRRPGNWTTAAPPSSASSPP